LKGGYLIWQNIQKCNSSKKLKIEILCITNG